MTIREATLADIDELFVLACAVHRQSPYTMLVPDEQRPRFLAAFQAGSSFEAKFKAKLSRLIRSPVGHVFIAEIDEHAAGYRAAEVVGDTLLLHGLFVDQQYRGLGIGKALFQTPLHLTPHKGKARLTVLADNTVAKNLYESLGFRKVSDAPKEFYGAKQIIMERKTVDNH